jgi:MarR family transcriptional regulator, organic hydroperoxide resistance regulator
MDQEDRFSELLSQVAREVTRRQNSEVCCGTLTLQQFQTLQTIERSERASIGSLSAEMGVDLSTMSRNISLLERDGYLMRARSEEDSRVVRVHLVAKGRRALKTLQCSERNVLKDVYGRLADSDRPRALKVLEALRDCLTKGTLEDAVCCPTAPQRKRGAGGG